MDIQTYVASAINEAISHLARPETQKILASHQPTYSLFTVSSCGAGTDAILPATKVLTPYAGPGYGMVCLPRNGFNVVTMPIRGKNSSTVAVGAYYTNDEDVPYHEVGDFLIKHETKSELLFRISQPASYIDGSYSGDLVILKNVPELTSGLSKTFTVTLGKEATDRVAVPLRPGDLISIEYIPQKIAHKESFGTSISETRWFKYQWIAPLVARGKDEYIVDINDKTIVSVAPIPYYDSADLSDDRFFANRILPTKGFAHFRHYTGSILLADEDTDYTLVADKKDGRVASKRANLSALMAPNAMISAENKEGKKVQKPAFSKVTKGQLHLRHYTESGLRMAEQEPQVLGHGVSCILALEKQKPLLNNYLDYEGVANMMPSMQLIMRDITQDNRSVATLGKFRQISSSSISDDVCVPRGKYPLVFQKEDDHYGVDFGHVERVELDGSGWNTADYLRQFDIDKKGWKFVTIEEAEKQYEENNNKYRDDNALTNGYDISIKDIIVPASGRRDVLLRHIDRPKSDQKSSNGETYREVHLLDFLEKAEDGKWKVIKGKAIRNDGSGDASSAIGIKDDVKDNRELIGQKGYMHKALVDTSSIIDKSFEDGYLCFPKGAVGVKHYTRSGLEVRELEPNLDFHALQMSLSLFNWDMGNYFQPYHAFDKKHDFSKMKFGPMPVPSAQVLLEGAKFDLLGGGEEEGVRATVSMPTTPRSCHTVHPQPNLLEYNVFGGESNLDEKERTTLATQGETGSLVGLYQYTSQIQSIVKPKEGSESASTAKTLPRDPVMDGNRLGSRLLFRDYVIHATPSDRKSPLMVAGKWWNVRGTTHSFIAPKGSMELNHYTTSGLMVYDQRLHYLNKYGGGHAMGMELVMRSLDFLKVAGNSSNNDPSAAVPIFANEDGSFKQDGSFFCKIVSNELVDSFKDTPNTGKGATDKGYKYTPPPEHDPKEQKCRYWSEDDKGEPTLRAKKKISTPEKGPHGKRAATIGITQDTTRAENYDVPGKFYFEDYIVRLAGAEGEELKTVLHPAHQHIYKKAGETRVVIMPRGGVGLDLYNKSGFYIGDARRDVDLAVIKDPGWEEPQNIAGWTVRRQVTGAPVKNPNTWSEGVLEDTPLDRGKAQLAYLHLNLWEWNNQEIEKNKGTKAKPFEDVSMVLQMDQTANGASYYGVGALRFLVHNLLNKGKKAEVGSRVIIEDFKRDAPGSPKKIQKPDEVLETTCHIYDPGDLKQLTDNHKMPVFPKGMMNFQNYNFSGLFIEDLEKNQIPDIPKGDRPKKQLASLHLTLNEWDNYRAPDSNTCPCKPYVDQSIDLTMKCLANYANWYREDATLFSVHSISSKCPAKTYGSSIAFEEFVKVDGTDEDGNPKVIPCNIYKKDNNYERHKELVFPKGKIWLQMYNESGLFVEDFKHSEGKEQQVKLRLAMHEWDNSKADIKEHVDQDSQGSGQPFEQDSCALTMEELTPKATREGKRASKMIMEALTSRAGAATYGSSLSVEDFIDGELPSHIYEDSSLDGTGKIAKLLFPKGKVELMHYTTSGLVLEDLQTERVALLHQPSVTLRLREWDEDKPNETNLAQFFAFDTTEKKSERAINIGFNHEATQSRCFLLDQNKEKDDHKMMCAMYHWDTSYLKFDDLTDSDNKQVDIKLHHMKGSYLFLHQKNESPGDMLVDLHHMKETGYKVDNTDEQVTLTIYHQKGTTVVIDPDGNVTVNSVKNITATAAQSITATAGTSAAVTAPTISLNGNVTINGTLSVTGNISGASYNTAPGNQM